jgi:hypothetical protein
MNSAQKSLFKNIQERIMGVHSLYFENLLSVFRCLGCISVHLFLLTSYGLLYRGRRTY